MGEGRRRITLVSFFVMALLALGVGTLETGAVGHGVDWLLRSRA